MIRSSQLEETRLPAGEARLAAHIVGSFGIVWVLTLVIAVLLLPAANLVLINKSGLTATAWLRDVYFRKEAYAARTLRSPAPRIMVIGGSAPAFGIDCELIERKLGVPTINDASHAGLGIRYLLTRARRHLRAGDTALLCLEYALCWNDEYCAEIRRDLVLTADRRYLTEIPLLDAAWMLYTVPLKDYGDSWNFWWESAGARRRYAPYSVVTMSVNGDVHHAISGTRPFDPALTPTLDPALLAEIGAFCQWAKAHEIRVLATYPNAWLGDEPAAIAVHLAAVQPYVELYRTLNVPTLGTPGEWAYPRYMFIDTHYHLNQPSRRIRTERLVDYLRPFFQTAPQVHDERSLYVMGSAVQSLSPGNLLAGECRYLTEGTPDGRGVLRGDEMAARALQGSPVYFDDRDEVVKASLKERQLSYRAESSAHVSLDELLQRYSSHLFLVTWEPSNNAAASDLLPAEWKSLLAVDGFRVAIMGTGRYSGVRVIRRGETEAAIKFSEGDSVDGAWRALFAIALRSGRGAAEQGAMVLNKTVLATGNEPGLTVAVVDPEIGVVLGQHTFQSSPALDWQLDRVVAPDKFKP